MKKYFHFIFFLYFIFSCGEDKQRELNPPPEVNQVIPASGFVGDVVTIVGKRFLADPAANAVSFGGIVAEVQSVIGDSELTVIVPEGASTGNIIVGSADAATEGPIFTVLINRNPPTIISVSNQSLEIGEVVFIAGTNFIATENVSNTLNQVWLGDKRMTVVKATATQLAAVVPTGTVGDQDLIVKVQGAASSAQKVSVSGFSNTLYWTLIPNENIPNDKINQLIARVAADGSTILNAREWVAIADDSSTTKAFLKYSLAGPKAFSPLSDQLYYIRNDRSDSLLRTAAPGFDHFEKVLSDEEVGGVLSVSTALAVRESSQEVFYAYGAESIINRGTDFFGFVSSASVSNMVAGSDVLYLVCKDVSGNTSLQKISYTTPDGVAELINTTSSLPTPGPGAAGIVNIQYSARIKSLYIVYQQTVGAPIQLYQLNELDGNIKLLANNLPLLGNLGQSKFALLDAASGPKFYGIGFPMDDIVQDPGSQVMYMVNLKPNVQGNYQPITICRDVLKLPGRNETTQFVTGQQPFSAVDFLFVDDN